MGSMVHFHAHAPTAGGSGTTSRRHTGAMAHIPRRIDRRSDAISHRVEFRVSMLDTSPMKEQRSEPGIPAGHGVDPPSRSPLLRAKEGRSNSPAASRIATAKVNRRDAETPRDRVGGSLLLPLGMGCIAQIHRGGRVLRRREIASARLLRVSASLRFKPSYFPLGMGSFAQICPSRPTSAGMPGECRVASPGRPRPSSH